MSSHIPSNSVLTMLQAQQPPAIPVPAEVMTATVELPSWNGTYKASRPRRAGPRQRCCGVFGCRDGPIAEVREYLGSLHAARVVLGRAM